MRSHFLSKLPITGKERVLEKIPNFDFYNLDHIEQINLKRVDDGFDLELKALYKGESALIGLRFVNVQLIKFPEMQPSFYLSELEIEDMSGSQIEGVKYRANNYGMTQFEVLSRDMEIAI